MMMGMMSNGVSRSRRKPPAERRAEIVESAARIALDEGLERVTLRAVAEQLGVRPGLISHYFPVAEELVVEAFALAITGEREWLFSVDGEPLDRIAGFLRLIERDGAKKLSALWLNARHLSRFLPGLGVAIAEQEALDRARLIGLIEAGVSAEVFSVEDPLTACIRIFMAVDGYGTYVNNPGTFEHPAFVSYVADVTAWALRLDAGLLRERLELMP